MSRGLGDVYKRQLFNCFPIWYRVSLILCTQVQKFCFKKGSQNPSCKFLFRIGRKLTLFNLKNPIHPFDGYIITRILSVVNRKRKIFLLFFNRFFAPNQHFSIFTPSRFKASIFRCALCDFRQKDVCGGKNHTAQFIILSRNTLSALRATLPERGKLQRPNERRQRGANDHLK